MENLKAPVILIIDDSLAQIKVLRDRLQQYHWEIHTCTVPSQAEQKAQELLPDLILLDVMMPEVDGFEVCRCLKASSLTYKIPIIFLSALSNLEDKVKGFHLGAVDFIPKDFHLDEIVVRIELHLKIYQLTQTLEQKNQHLQNLAQKQQEMALALKSSEEMFMTAFHCSPDPIVIIDLQTFHILEANASFSELIGYPLSHILGKVDLELNFWADFQQRTLILQMTKAHQLLQNQEVLFLNHQQELQYILLSSKLITFNQQEAVLLLPKNITDQKNTEEQLKILSQACEQSPVSIVITDHQGAIHYANPKFAEISGYTLSEVIGQNPRVLKSGETSPEEYQYLWTTITSGKTWHGEFHNRKKNGELYWERASISPIFNTQGVITHFVAVKEDITLRKQQEEQLYFQANFDPVTHLPNRTLAMDRLNQAIEIAYRHHHKTAVMFIDLDRFKAINDTLGHDQGDELLRETGQRLQSCLRKTDTVARLGGDEFLVILPKIKTAVEVAAIARRILNLLRHPLQLDLHEVFVNASIGVAIYPEDGSQNSDLLKNADTAMYAAKADGRNTFKFFTAAMNTTAQNRLQLEYNLRRALINQEFSLAYQPLIHLASGKIIGAESLIRWQSHALGDIPPQQFIPLAEETGLIVELGEWIMREALDQLHQWQTVLGERETHLVSPEFCLAINVSPRQLKDMYFFDSVREALAIHQISPHCLELEITEQLLMEQNPDTLKVLQQLQHLGICLSIDDFGTGYSSLSYLRKFKFSVLKIDRSFITELPDHPEDSILVKAIIAMAHQLKLKVIAEGVETAAQMDFLAAQHCDYVQGHFFSPAIAAPEFTQLLQRQPFSFAALPYPVYDEGLI